MKQSKERSLLDCFHSSSGIQGKEDVDAALSAAAARLCFHSSSGIQGKEGVWQGQEGASRIIRFHSSSGIQGKEDTGDTQ